MPATAPKHPIDVTGPIAALAGTFAFACRLWLAFGLLLLPVAGFAQGQPEPNEFQLRALFAFNFLKFTEWPAGKASDLLLCSASDDARVLAALDDLGGRHVRDRRIKVLQHGTQALCDVVVVDSRSHWLAISPKYARRPVLTIGGYAGFAQDGGMIELAFEQGAPRFDINLGQARRSELRFYPELLRLARRVIE